MGPPLAPHNKLQIKILEIAKTLKNKEDEKDKRNQCLNSRNNLQEYVRMILKRH